MISYIQPIEELSNTHDFHVDQKLMEDAPERQISKLWINRFEQIDGCYLNYSYQPYYPFKPVRNYKLFQTIVIKNFKEHCVLFIEHQGLNNTLLCVDGQSLQMQQKLKFHLVLRLSCSMLFWDFLVRRNKRR